METNKNPAQSRTIIYFQLPKHIAIEKNQRVINFAIAARWSVPRFYQGIGGQNLSMI